MPTNSLLPGDFRPMAVKRRLSHDADLYSPDFNVIGNARSANFESGSLVEYWRILTKRKGTLLLIAAIGIMAGFFFTKLQSPIYRARTLVEIESINEDFLNMRDVSQTSTDASTQSPEYNVRTQITILQSRPVLERTLQKLNLESRMLADVKKHQGFFYRPPEKPLSAAAIHDQIINLASESLRVRSQPNTRVLEITFDAKDPHIAADFVNSLTSAFTEVTLENRLQYTQNTSAWLSRQIQDVKAKLKKSQEDLQNYAHASDLTFMSQTETDTTSQDRLKELQLEISRAEEDRILKQSRYELARKAPPESLPEVVDDSTLRDYHVQLTQLRRQLADLLSSFTSDYPKVVSTRAQIKAIETALERERSNIIARTGNEYQSAVRRENLVNKNYSALIGLMSTQADKLSHYSLLKREVDTTRNLYDAMTQRVKEADLASAMKASNIHVIEAAQPPHTPYKPIASLNMAFGLVSGLGLGCLVLIQRARTNTRIQEPGDTTFELNVPELGVIPAGQIEKRSPIRMLLGKTASAVADGKPELSTWENAPSVLAESFRLTLTSILLSSSQDKRPTVIALSSANAGEGKTTVVSNLAIVLARMNRRVLLVDGDLRKRRLHRIFEVSNNVGLKEALAAPPASSTGASSVFIQQTKIPNLFVLPSGKGNTGEMIFFTAQLRDFLQRLKTEFDMILIDTPPLLQVADARLICHEADAAVLVVAQHTPREMVVLARQRLADDGSDLLGTILNRYDPKTSLHGYENYGNYYSDYYGAPARNDSSND